MRPSGWRHSSKVAFAPILQLPRVRFSAFPFSRDLSSGTVESVDSDVMIEPIEYKAKDFVNCVNLVSEKF